MVCIRRRLSHLAFAYVILFYSPIFTSWRSPWGCYSKFSSVQVSDENLLHFSEAAVQGRPALGVSYKVPSVSAVRRKLFPPASAAEEREAFPRSALDDASLAGSQAAEETPGGREHVGPTAVAASDGSNSSETAGSQEAGAPEVEREKGDTATPTIEEKATKDSEVEVERVLDEEQHGKEESGSTVPLAQPSASADGARVEDDRDAIIVGSEEAAPPSDAEEVPPAEEAARDEDEESDKEDEEEEEEGIDFQLYLPQQLRKVIPGTNIDYYDYVIMEERLARGETDDPPDVRSGLLPDAPEKTIPQVTFKNGVFAYCYTVETGDLLSRCVDAANLGEGVYIPMVNMTDFGRHDDREQGNPSLQVVSLSRSHYTEAASPFPPSWFEAVRQLKNTTHLAVGGIWFGPPDFKEMDAILREHPRVFDGILVDWDSGKGACMNELTTPPPFNPRGQHTVWWKPKEFFMRYYMGGQDKEICRLKDGRPYTLEVFISSNERELDVPFGWNMTFPCFGGYEGRCYKAFASHADEACSDAQRYIFAPYDRASESMRIFLNDTCAGIGKVMPPHDVVLAV